MTDSTNPTTTFLMLKDSTVVSKDFYVEIKRHVLGRLTTLPAGMSRELRQICGPDFWGTLSNGDRRTAGICVSNMVAQHEVPLIHMPQKQQYPKKYCQL